MSSHVVGQNIDKLRFDWGVTDIEKQTESLMQTLKEVKDSVANVKPENISFQTVVQPIINYDTLSGVISSNLTFPSQTSTDKAIRDASTSANTKYNNFSIDQDMREDVYKVFKQYTDKNEALGPQEQRFLDKVMRGFRRSGLHLPEDQRKQVQEMFKQISEKSIAFQKNTTEDNSKVLLTADDLEGVPADVIKGFKTETHDGVNKYVVTMKYPDVFPALKYSKKEATRKTLEKCFASRCKDQNTPLLEEVVSLRHKLANILGYPTHSDYVLEIRMAKTSDAVQKFYQQLRPKLAALAATELQTMLQLKKEETGDKFDGKINSWDFSYYDRIVNEKMYSVNEQEIKEYFPLEKVVKGTLDIYQQLLGLKFVEVEKPHVWHHEVSAYQVFDKDSDKLIGHFYMDLFPREGKYGHAAAFPLQRGCELPDGSRQLPSSAMVCNFVKPLPDTPSLLRHDEVETFFHEFGHIMHGICALAKYSRFAGTSTERDFVECPSQMLENWCWDKEILKRISAHYKTGEPLPDSIVDKMIAAKNANSGMLNLRQVFYGFFDQTIHTRDHIDSASLYNQLKKEITLTEGQEDTNGAASFGHLMGGYDASYYGYLYSKVFSADMFDQFDKNGIMNPSIGKKYRDTILAPGGSKDGDEMLRDFMGRDPKMEPFLHSIGLQSFN